MPEKRVVITGMGWITPLGFDVDSVWAKLLSGMTAVRPLTRFPGETFATSFASEVREFELFNFLDHRAARYAEAAVGSRFALAAAMQAWVHAGLGSHLGPRLGEEGSPDIDPRRFGVYLGAGEGKIDLPAFATSTHAGWDPEARSLDVRAWAETAGASYTRVAEFEQEPSAALSHVAREFGLRGPVGNCVTACAAGAQCVGEAAELIRRGDADLMLTGGSHSMIHPLGMSGFIRLTAMSTRSDDPTTASRPFDSTRDGFVMGEGAGMLVIEDLEHARARGANIVAEIAGYGSSADAYRITDIDPEGEGAAIAMRAALQQAGIDPAERLDDGRPPVQWINAHGTGTQENDAIETKAVKLTFGELAGDIPFTSVKSMLGHLIQAAGTVELITCVKAIETGWIPPTINLESPDPRCDLDAVPNEARDTDGRIDTCLSNSFGFGGQNDSVCITRYVP
ncbi:MAG: beta-ketoacyl-[acyl-carrier-protein] synthase family protein [Planctomycetota bacterium]